MQYGMCEWNALQSKGFIFRNGTIACAIVLSLFWSLAHSQTYPCVTFMGQTLAKPFLHGPQYQVSL